jgi:hypothetical protein
VSGTRGRALDHIGFEVENLAAFVKRLAAHGIKVDVGSHPESPVEVSSVILTDPWGTSIELTEGLDRYRVPH